MNKHLKYTTLVLTFTFVVGAFFLSSCSKKPEETKGKDEKGSSSVTIGKTLEDLEKEAIDLMKQKEWCNAKSKWEEIKKQAGEDKQYLVWSQKADGNLQWLESTCEGTDKPIEGTKVTEPSPPKEITSENLLKYYKKGRSVKSVGYLKIEGRGINKGWGIKGEAHFKYVSRIVMKSTVEENDNTELTFLVEYPVVDQTRIVSEKEFQLDLPDSPLSSVAGAVIDKSLNVVVPYYHQAKSVAKLLFAIDPNYKKTLTWLGNELDIPAGEDLEIVTKIDKLVGAKFRMKYVSGLGVVSIKDLKKSGLFNKSELDNIAYQSSLLIDYFIMPNHKKKGDEWNVRIEDVGRLISIGYDTKMSGIIRLKRESDVKLKGKTNALLTVKIGDIKIQGDIDEGNQEVDVKVSSGTIHYSTDDLLTRKAELEFNANTMWQSRGNLLFDTKKIRDLDVKAIYEAELHARPIK